jgi:hypothetical protein
MNSTFLIFDSVIALTPLICIYSISGYAVAHLRAIAIKRHPNFPDPRPMVVAVAVAEFPGRPGRRYRNLPGAKKSRLQAVLCI